VEQAFLPPVRASVMGQDVQKGSSSICDSKVTTGNGVFIMVHFPDQALLDLEVDLGPPILSVYSYKVMNNKVFQLSKEHNLNVMDYV
jgi:hypothetical protein